VFRATDKLTGKEISTDVALEPNMFPYECPPGVTHWTLWSRHEMSPRQICAWTKTWLRVNKPGVTKWNFDMNDNNSVDVPHYHVFLYEPPAISAAGRKQTQPPEAVIVPSAEEANDEKKSCARDLDAACRAGRLREKTRSPRTPPPFGDEAQEKEK
jgi:hypothetical protein